VALVGRHRAAVVQTDGPVVQRAGHALAEDHALAQRAALVRAAVEQRKDLALRVAEHGHVQATLARHGARAQHGDVVDAADGPPVGRVIGAHWVTSVLRTAVRAPSGGRAGLMRRSLRWPGAGWG